MRNIYLLGDIHAQTKFHDRLLGMPPGELYILGDVGFGFDPECDKGLYKAFKRLTDKGWEIYLIRGNHDNPIYWYENRNDNNDKVHFLKDNSIIEINGEKFLVVGGGVSVDKMYRTKDKNWWDGEEITLLSADFYDEIKDEILGIISHSGPLPPGIIPLTFSQDIMESLERENMAISFLQKHLSPKKWLHAHFHCHNKYISNNCNYICLDIEELFLYEG